MTDEDTEDKLDEVRQKSTSGGGSRLDADEVRDDVVDELVDALRAADEGDLSKTLSVWDPEMAALLDVLLGDQERAHADVEALAERLEASVEDGGPVDRSDLLKLAIRVGLREVDEEIFADLHETRRERAIQTASEGI